jgi:hypothetical protein
VKYRRSPYYVMLYKFEDTQQMVKVEGNKNKDKKVLKVADQEDYEKSGFKSIMDNVEETKKQALESVPQIPRGQSQVEKRSQCSGDFGLLSYKP